MSPPAKTYSLTVRFSVNSIIVIIIQLSFFTKEGIFVMIMYLPRYTISKRRLGETALGPRSSFRSNYAFFINLSSINEIEVSVVSWKFEVPFPLTTFV